MKCARVSSGLLLCLFLCLLAGPVLGSSWRFSNPRPHGNNILDMGIRSNVVWQVGDRGRVYTSQNLDQWMPHETGTDQSLRGIAFFGENVFISGQEGTILSGPNAPTLTVRSLGTTDWLEGIAASPAMLVAVGDNGAIYSSPDGLNWTRRGNYSAWLRSVAFGGGQFLCVGEDGFIGRSDDGQSWELASSGTTAHLNKAAWVEDRFWIVGENGTVLTNTVEMAFVPVNVPVTNTLFSIAANSNEVVIAGDSAVLLGNRATGTWTSQADLESPELAPLWPYYSSLWDGRLFLLGGHAGLLVEGFRTNSNAPLIWYSNVQPTRSWLWAVKRTPDFYVAVGATAAIVTSEDGVEWHRETAPEGFEDEVLLGIGGNTNLLFAVGSNGTVLRSQNRFTNVVSTNALGQLETNLVSLFGLEWDSVNVPASVDLQGVAEREGLFVITGAGGLILTSSDGSNWQERASGVTTFLSGVTAWPEGFVAVGDSGVILTSENGTSWTRRNSGTEDWVYSVRYAGGKLIAVGENGLVLTSDNGTEWTARNSGTSEWLNDAAFAGGVWRIAGSGGMLVTSTNTTRWTASKAITSNSLYGAAADGEQMILVGMEGVALRSVSSGANTPVNIISYGHAGENSVFLLGGVVDQRFVLEESRAATGPWSSSAFLELSEPGGTLIHEKTNDDGAVKFFRTRLLDATPAFGLGSARRTR